MTDKGSSLESSQSPRFFPDEFKWGFATSSGQSESGLDNEWTEWMVTHAEEIARDARPEHGFDNGVPLSNETWERIKKDVKNPDNYRIGDAAEADKNYQAELEEMRALGANAYRFSLEWSKIEPSPGNFDADAITHYGRVLDKCRELGLVPFVTLHHFTNPTWFASAGGWKQPAAAALFSRYTQAVVEQLDSPEIVWGTINEPNVYALKSFKDGDWPPGETSALSTVKVYRHLADGHMRAYDTIKGHSPEARVAAIINTTDFTPALTWREPINRMAATALDYVANQGLFFRLSRGIKRDLQGTQDYYGVNHYMRCQVDGLKLFTNDRSLPRSDMGWFLEPDSLGAVVRNLPNDGRMIYITEHGLADARDKYRPWFTRKSLASLALAGADGANIGGYFSWTWKKNFEWDKGYWPAFSTQPGLENYGAIMRSNGEVLKPELDDAAKRSDP